MADKSNVPLLSAEGPKKYYASESGILFHPSGMVRVVDGVSFQLFEGETLGLMEEPGRDKSTSGHQLVGLKYPMGGYVIYDGNNLDNMSQTQMGPLRTQLQMIFRDSYSPLNPRRHVFEILPEPMLYHGLVKRGNVYSHVEKLLNMIGPPKNYPGRYSHESSGGQRQHIDITRALSLSPKLLVCDEPASALDVSTQAQILSLLKNLQRELGLTCIFIGHGLGAVDYVSDWTVIMYLRKIAKVGGREELFDHPFHPYSKVLLGAVPISDPRRCRKRSEGIVGGETVSNVNTPSGCPFHPRRPRYREGCMSGEMELKPAAPGSSHPTACTWYKESEKEIRQA